jgi:hypothetical protein
MIFIYLPNVVLFFVWFWQVELNIFLSILLTPVSYILINGGLVYYRQFELVHQLLDKTIILTFAENQVKNFIFFILGLINRISYVNKFYLWLKVKVLMYLFNLVAGYMTSTNGGNNKTEKGSELTNKLENDYLEILNRNKRKRTTSISTTDLGLD